jgi:membrane fusion protein (multidrug efflux system)
MGLISRIVIFLVCSGFQNSNAAEEPWTVAQGLSSEIRVRAQLRPINHTLISAGIPGRIATFSKRAGEKIEQGELVASFDCRKIEASFGIFETKLKAANKQLQINRRLSDLENISSLNMSLSEAEVSIAVSELSAAKALRSECRVMAPFSGEIIEKFVQAYQHVSEGEPLFSIIDTQNLEVEMVVPSAHIPDYQIGREFAIVIDETGQSVNARIHRVIGSVDPVSQTVNVIGQLAGQTPGLLPGMSGVIALKQEN